MLHADVHVYFRTQAYNYLVFVYLVIGVLVARIGVNNWKVVGEQPLMVIWTDMPVSNALYTQLYTPLTTFQN